MSRIRLPTPADPRVSLVVVVYGSHARAKATLASLADTVDAGAEVLVVDNASPDGAGARLQDEVDGARFLLQDRNLGFPTAVDLGVLHTRAPFVGILNSDLEFVEGWLEHLVSALEADPRAGAATPTYLTDTGVVTEAGVLVGGDGRGYGYGDGLSSDRSEVSFRRYVDYGSAAALVVRRAAFDRVGGFDPAYGLGYFEDADFCFSLRDIGYETVFVPDARVHHVGGGSFTPASREALSAKNRSIFADRFARMLRGRPTLARPPFDPHRDLVVRDWSCADRLLVLDGTGALAGFAAEVQRRWPDARVTWVSLGGTAGPPGDDRVERVTPVARLDQWLESRRFHYGAVVLGPSMPADMPAWLDHSQPQALRGVAKGVAVSPGDVVVRTDPPLEAMAALGFGSPSRGPIPSSRG